MFIQYPIIVMIWPSVRTQFELFKLALMQGRLITTGVCFYSSQSVGHSIVFSVIPHCKVLSTQNDTENIYICIYTATICICPGRDLNRRFQYFSTTAIDHGQMRKHPLRTAM
jgi:hypothetical protein